ncbi:MAG: hypothetical protein IKH30_09215 [Clostridia bacterium]|nr:hypothetical protein [Clostridia bacterium]
MFFSFNMIVSLSMEHSDLKAILLPLRSVGMDMVLHISAFAGFFLLCHGCVHILYTLFDRKDKQLAKDDRETKGNHWFFLIAFTVIAACWTPSFIAFYPLRYAFGHNYRARRILRHRKNGRFLPDPGYAALWFGSLAGDSTERRRVWRVFVRACTVR